MKQFITTEIWYSGRVSCDSGGGRSSIELDECDENVYVVGSVGTCSAS